MPQDKTYEQIDGSGQPVNNHKLTLENFDYFAHPQKIIAFVEGDDGNKNIKHKLYGDAGITFLNGPVNTTIEFNRVMHTIYRATKGNYDLTLTFRSNGQYVQLEENDPFGLIDIIRFAPEKGGTAPGTPGTP